MDNRTLNAAEISSMKLFIASRSLSFKEPGIMAEILDHFACKTEEIWNEHPRITFQQAMEMAHQSFGVKGFAPIAAAWEANTSKHYKRWGRKATYQIFFSTHVIGISAISVLMAELYWILAHRVHFPFHGFEMLIAIQLIAIIIIFSNKPGKSIRQKHPLLYGIASQADTIKQYALFFILPLLVVNAKIPIMAQAITAGMATFYYSFYCVHQLELHRKILSEINSIELQIGQ